jgi:DNA polymerase-1
MASIKELLLKKLHSKEFNPIEPSENIIIIDAMNLFHRNISTNLSLDLKGNHIGGIVGTLNSLYSIIRNFKPSKIIICFEGDNSTDRRKAIFKDYKGNREGKGVCNRKVFFSEEESDESFNYQLLTLITILQNFPVLLISQDFLEADDTIGYIASKSSLKSKNITIISNDGDYLQLINDNVKVYNPMSKILFNDVEIFNKYEINYKNFLLYKTLIGDTSDNIPNIKGIGLKTLIKMCPQISTDEITHEEFYQFCEEKSKEKKSLKVYKEVCDNIELIELNKKLMNLSDVKLSNIEVMELEEKINQEITFDFKQCITKCSKFQSHLFVSTLNFVNEFSYLNK